MYVHVFNMLRCHGFDVWSFVMSLVPSATMPFLGTEKQVQQAKYFNQGHHTLNRRQSTGHQTVPVLLHKLGDRKHYEEQT